MKRVIPIGVVVLAVLLVLVGAGAWYLHRENANGSSYRTVGVKRGDLLATISATGTVEPEEVVDVGAQVAGQILSFGKDKSDKTIDYGSAVEVDTILAQIDDSVYKADAASAQAQLEESKAGVTKAEADLGQLKAKLRSEERRVGKESRS